MAIKDDIHTLIRLAREKQEKLATREPDEIKATLITITGWLQGIEEALVLLAGEIEDLKRRRVAENEEQ